VSIHRPSWIEIDLDAIRHNTRVARRLVGPTVKIFAVCKGDGYGLGAGILAKTAIGAGADAAACSAPEEARAIRAAGVTAPILLYASTSPTDAAAVAALGVIATIHDFSSLDAFANLPVPTTVYVKLDCGFGRLGFIAEEWNEAFRRLAGSNNIRVAGLYCHLGCTDDRSKMEPQLARFRAAATAAAAMGLRNVDLMVASSRVMIGHADLNMTAVNPGRLICGMLEPPWDQMADIQPVFSAFKSRIIQVKTLAAGAAIAYGADAFTGEKRIAIAPVGFADGYPRLPAGGTALIRGQQVPILGPRSTEHTSFDVSRLPDAAVDDEVVLLGRQEEHTITGNDVAAATGVPLIELWPRIARLAQRVYLG
jgi:alanine racemase